MRVTEEDTAARGQISRRRALGVLAGASVGLVVACSAPPAAAPASPVASAAPAATAAPVGQASGSSLDQMVAAAKSEGGVAVIGPAGSDIKTALADDFQNAYGIPVDFLGGSSRDTTARVLNERSASTYNWDIWVGGTNDAIVSFLPSNAFAPIEPDLVLPDVVNPATWRNGAMEFLDPGHYVVIMTPYQQGTMYVNPNTLSPKTFSSYKDLLDPKWTGQIVLDDPRVSGPGQGTFTFFYLHPDLGPDYIRALAAQQPTILNDYRQEVDYVAQGKAPVLVGGSDATVEQSIRQGIPVAIIDPRDLKEGSELSPANGALALFDAAPHPNAAKLYVNWLLSKDGQTDYVNATSYVSARLDVPTDNVEPWRVPIPGSIKTYDEQAITVTRPALITLLKELFPR